MSCFSSIPSSKIILRSSAGMHSRLERDDVLVFAPLANVSYLKRFAEMGRRNYWQHSLGVTFFPCGLAPSLNIGSHRYTTPSQNLSTTAFIKRSSSLARRPTARSSPLLTSKLTICLLLADLAMPHRYFSGQGRAQALMY